MGGVVSIHAPTWGATNKKIAAKIKSKFQSTHPHGVRQFRRRTEPKSTCFNPRTHMGCDANILANSAAGLMFQSTHPHGVRQPLFTDVCSYLVFQSTHPHGVRPVPTFNELNAQMFQSTHPHGVRHVALLAEEVEEEFQSTHPHGVRL